MEAERGSGFAQYFYNLRITSKELGITIRITGATSDLVIDVNTFERTMLPHLSAAQHLARWLTRNQHDAEDIVQEAYLRAFRFFEGFQGSDGRAWLLAVVRNTYFSWTRREHSRPPAESFDEAAHAIAHENANAEDRLIDEANRRLLHDCLNGLRPDYRDILVMRELEDMSYREISSAASIPLGTVMSRLSRARKRLDQRVQERLLQNCRTR